MTQSIFGITFSWLHDLALPSMTVGPTPSSSTPTQLNISNYIRDPRRINSVCGLMSTISLHAKEDLNTQQRNTLLEYVLLFSQFEAYFYSSASDAALITIKTESFRIDSIYEKINKLIELHCYVHDNNLLKDDYLEKSYMFIICIIVKTIKNINESLHKLSEIKPHDQGIAFQSKLRQYNQDTTSLQITHLESTLIKIQKSYQALIKDKNIEKIILNLIKYSIVPTSMLYKLSDIGSSTDTVLPKPFPVQALPSHVFDILIEKIDTGEVNDEDAFAVIHLLINTPELKIEGIHHPVHHALVLLIAVHARILCQQHTTNLLFSSSSSHLFETSVEKAEAFISIPDTLCTDLMLLLHTNKAHEFMLLFNMYHQQLQNAHNPTTYLQNQLSLMLIESFQRMIKIKIRANDISPIERYATKPSFLETLGGLFSNPPSKPNEVNADFYAIKPKMLNVLEKLFSKLALDHAQATVVQRLSHYCHLLKSDHTAIDAAPKKGFALSGSCSVDLTNTPPLPSAVPDQTLSLRSRSNSEAAVSSSTLSCSPTSGLRLGLNSSGLYTAPALPSVIYLRIRRLLQHGGIAALSKINETTGETPLIAVVNEFCLDTLALIADYCNRHEQSIHDIFAKHVDAKNNNLLHHAIMRSSSAPTIYRIPDVSGEVGNEITPDIQLKCYQKLIEFNVNPQEKNQIDKTPIVILDEALLSDKIKMSIKSILDPMHQVRLQ